MAETEIYEITLSPNYVPDWGVPEAFRELLQNGIDQQKRNPKCTFTVEYDQHTKILKLINKNSRLKIETLVIGGGDKKDNGETIGMFGEGYKIAALVLNRNGKTVTIRNNKMGQLWETRFKNSAKWKQKILEFAVSKVECSSTDLVIEIGNVEPDEYDIIDEIWLNPDESYSYWEDEIIRTDYGEIILVEHFAGDVFVEGLFVCHIDKAVYGYNFKSKYIKLDRDRKAVSDWDFQNYANKMICAAILAGKINIKDMQEYIDSEAPDIGGFKFTVTSSAGGTSDSSKVAEMILKQFDETNPDSIPVSCQSDYDKVKAYGGTPVFVNSTLGTTFREITSKRITDLTSKAEFYGTLTVKERLDKWLLIYGKELSEQAKNAFNKIVKHID